MAANKSKRASSSLISYKVLNNLSSIDLEEPQKKKKRNRQRILGVYEAERLIAKRTNGEEITYLVKWRNYSAFESSWEPEHHLSKALLEYFEKPKPSTELIQEHLDFLRCSLLTALKGKAVVQNVTMNFRHDVFRYLFSSKRKEMVYGKWLFYDLIDFSKCKFPPEWSSAYDMHGDGPKVYFPIKMRYFLGQSSKTHYCDNNGNVKECNAMHIEKVSLQFAKIPGTCV